jgi:hypothetical protein
LWYENLIFLALQFTKIQILREYAKRMAGKNDPQETHPEAPQETHRRPTPTLPVGREARTKRLFPIFL